MTRVAAFFGLTYVITWGGILWFLASIGFDLASIGLEQAMAMFGLMLLGPAAAGLGMALLTDGLRGAARLLSGIGRVRPGLRWYAFALLPTPLLLMGVLLPLSVFASPDYAPAFLAFGIVAGLLAGTAEEIGWTGYATPRLLDRLSPFIAGLVLGLVWALWHGLADFAGTIATMSFGEWLVRMVVMWIVPLTGYRVLMTWAYAHHRSLALSILMHASYTGWLAALTMEMATSRSQLLLWHAIFGTGVWLMVAAIVMASRMAVPWPLTARRSP
jgi:uncharacterized protein